MKVAKDLTSNAAYFFSMTGNTKSLLEKLYNLDEWNIYDLNEIDPREVDFKDYNKILIGTLTLGRGTPPTYFKKIFKQLVELKGRKIGLFGSGQSHYGDEYFCGALDVLEDLLRQENDISFKLKFESYPTPSVIDDFNNLVKEM